MSYAGFFERLLRKAEKESFNNQVLREIKQKKDRLKRRLQSLRVKGDFHKATEVQDQLDFLDKTEKTVRSLNHG